jgi:hypothetical protein
MARETTMAANRGGSIRTRDVRGMYAARGRRDYLNARQVSSTQNRLAHFANSTKASDDEDPSAQRRAEKAAAAAACVFVHLCTADVCVCCELTIHPPKKQTTPKIQAPGHAGCRRVVCEQRRKRRDGARAGGCTSCRIRRASSGTSGGSSSSARHRRRSAVDFFKNIY